MRRSTPYICSPQPKPKRATGGPPAFSATNPQVDEAALIDEDRPLFGSLESSQRRRRDSPNVVISGISSPNFSRSREPSQASILSNAIADMTGNTPAKPNNKSRSGGCKCWCFTWHVEVDAEGKPRHTPVLHAEMDYICCQLEQCPTTKQFHWQGYVEMREREQLSMMKTVLAKTVHWEKRRGSQKEAIDYTKKDDTAVADTWFQLGVPHPPDASNMLSATVDDIKNGLTLQEIAVKHTKAVVIYGRGIRDTMKLLNPEPPNFRQVKCYLYYGAAGSGKTRKAITENPEAYIKPNGAWWDGLPLWTGMDEKLKVLILDDFYGNERYADMLRILDGYKLQCPTKGGFTWAWWSTVIITSNVHRDEWYKNVPHDVKAALNRRLPEENILYFDENGVIYDHEQRKSWTTMNGFFAPGPTGTIHGANNQKRPTESDTTTTTSQKFAMMIQSNDAPQDSQE